MEFKTNLKLNARLMPVIVGNLLLLDLLVPWDGWVVLLAGLGGAWLLAYFYARSLSQNLHLKREMRFGWAQVGDRLEERFTVSNLGWLPGLWIEVEDHTRMPGYNAGRVTGVGGNSENRWLTGGICAQRGVFRLGPTTLRSGDPLGLYTVEIHYPRSADLLITPPIIPLPTIEVAPGGRSGEGRPRPDAPDRTVSAAAVREYQYGDELRWVHWPTTARRGEFYVRLFDGTPAGDWWIILDLDQSVQFGLGAGSTEENGVILAASLADRGLRLGRSVGLVANGQNLGWQPPREGDGQRWEILRSLALVRPGERPLDELLKRLRPVFGRQASLVIITPNTSGGWVEELLPLLWTGAVPTVLLLDPVSFGAEARSISQSAPALGAALTHTGIGHYIITRGLLDRPEARPGQAGRWEWRVSPTGRAVAIHKPRDLNWKTLS